MKNLSMKKIPAKSITNNNTPQLRETRIHGNSLFPFMLYDIQSDTTFMQYHIGTHKEIYN